MELNFPQELWDLSNLITGFVVVQKLTWIYGLQKAEAPGRSRRERLGTLFGSVLALASYIIGVWWCYRTGIGYLKDENHSVWLQLACGQTGIILLFYIFWALALTNPHRGHAESRVKE